MKLIKFLFLLLISFLPFFIYAQKSNIVSGNIKMDNKWHNKIYLLKIDKSNNFYRGGIPEILIDSSLVDELGNFKFSNSKFSDTLTFYKLTIQLTQHKKYPTRGGKHNYLFLLLNKKSEIKLAIPNADSMKLNYNFTVGDPFNIELKKMCYLDNETLKLIAETDNNPYKVYFACASLYFQWNLRKSNEFNYYQKIYNRLQLLKPRNKYIKDFKEKLDENRYFLKIGDKAPEITLPDTNTNKISLSSFKGKYVLLDFWFAGCRPCREFNRNVLSKLYPYYKDKSFEIVSISIDKSKEVWQKAIKDDNANWIQLLNSETKGFSGIKNYNIINYPSNFLVDKEGKIIMIDIEKEELEEFLKAL